jgi:predicted DCC family thiol-disulfide oxidoreductase YuxK
MSANDETLLVYDGDCPFCSHYVSYMRLRDSVGPVTLLDARQGGPAVDDIRHQGYDLDEGMVLRLHGRYYHGADCVHALAMLSSESGVFNRINARIFRHPMLARRLYPIMRAGRNAVLVMLGRRRLKDSATLQP